MADKIPQISAIKSYIKKKAFNPLNIENTDNASSSSSTLDASRRQDLLNQQDNLNQSSEGSHPLEEDESTKKIDKKKGKLNKENKGQFHLEFAEVTDDSAHTGESSEGDHGKPGNDNNSKEVLMHLKDKDRDKEILQKIEKIIVVFDKHVADLSEEKVPVSPRLREDIYRRLTEPTPENKRYKNKIEDLLAKDENGEKIAGRDKRYFISEHHFLEERYGYIKRKSESRRFIRQMLYEKTHSRELREIKESIHYHHIDEKYEKIANTEIKRVNSLIVQSIRNMKLDNEMKEPILHSMILKHAEHARKIVNATTSYLVYIDKKY